jgi:yecA family protein
MSDQHDQPIDIDNAQQLGEFIAQLAAAADPDAPAITLDTLDGYMTALLVGPPPSAPIQAMDALFGDEWPGIFESQEQTDAFMDVLHLRWNEIADSLDPQALVESPEQMQLVPLISDFDDETKARLLADGSLTEDLLQRLPAAGALWAQGFLQAVEDTGSWELPEGDAARDLSLMLEAIEAVTLATNSDERATYIQDAYEEPEGIDQDALIDDMLFTVQDMRLFWLQQAALKAAFSEDGETPSQH